MPGNAEYLNLGYLKDVVEAAERHNYMVSTGQADGPCGGCDLVLVDQKKVLAGKLGAPTMQSKGACFGCDVPPLRNAAGPCGGCDLLKSAKK